MSFVPEGWQASSSELAGKTILVTGANRGIGEAVALNCAQHGAEVLLLGRDEASLTCVYDQIVDLGCPTPGIIPLDLTTRDNALYDTLADELSGANVALDGLVHNASVLGERRALAQTSPASWDEVLQVNMTAVFLLTRALMPCSKRPRRPRSCSQALAWGEEVKPIGALTQCRNLPPRAICRCLPMS